MIEFLLFVGIILLIIIILEVSTDSEFIQILTLLFIPILLLLIIVQTFVAKMIGKKNE